MLRIGVFPAIQRSCLFATLVFLWLWAGTASSLQAATDGNPASALEAEIDAYLQPYLNGRNFGGVVFIARGSRILLNKAYGMANYELGVPNTPHTKFHIASVSKPFTATAILLLEEQGLLRTSDPLTEFIPDYPNGNRITVHHLLTHTSGIPNVNGFPEYDRASKFPHQPEDLVEMFKGKPLEFEPGERYAYSNSNYNLLAYIIEKVSGLSYGAFLEENILSPLKMRDTAHHGDASALIENQASGYAPLGVKSLENAPYIDWSIKTGNGSLYSTAEDLYRFDRALYGSQLLSGASRTKMLAESGDQNSYGWFVRERFGRRVTATNGRSPGFTASMERFVEDDLCIIVLSNLYISTPIPADLAAIVLGKEYANPADIQPVDLSGEVLAPLTGRYRFGEDFFRLGVKVEVRMERSDLVLDWGGGFTSPLIPLSETKFIDRNFWAPVTFIQDAEGKVTRFLWRYEVDYPAERLTQD